MMAALSRALMALAVHSLGGHRSEWAIAMQAEFEAAKEDGTALAFAAGCLITACRQLPASDEGRFAIASYVLALGVIVPPTALLISSVLTGFPTSFLGHAGSQGLLAVGSDHGPLLSEGNSFAILPLASLLLLLAALNLRFAWLALERDWTRLTSAGALSAAATATLVIFSAVAFVDYVAALAQVAMLTVQLTAASALMRWHAQLSSASPGAPIR